MNKKITTTIGLLAAAATISATALPVFAQTSSAGVNVGVGASVSGTAGAGIQARVGARGTLSAASLSARITNITDHADMEIARRLAVLNALSTRVNAMVNLSASEKSGLSASIQAQITAMTALQGKVGADAAAESTSSLATDVRSIVSSYRIFVLVLPQGAIEAASDRILTIVNIMNSLSGKLSARISEAASAGNNVTASQSALADMNAKIADAGTQAQAANAEVASLTPDNGNTQQMQANTAALKDARTKIGAAQTDLLAAREDAKTIIKAIGTFKVSAGATSSVSSSATGQ